ncbi:MAG: hypothetical protein K0R80_2242 [Clostridia bacterium]|jgi:hypothetical protein|nr:hypothetical protein [Clostridia bacterium]
MKKTIVLLEGITKDIMMTIYEMEFTKLGKGCVKYERNAILSL